MPTRSNQNKELGKVFLEVPPGICIEKPRKYYSIQSATKARQRGRREREREDRGWGQAGSTRSAVKKQGRGGRWEEKRDQNTMRH